MKPIKNEYYGINFEIGDTVRHNGSVYKVLYFYAAEYKCEACFAYHTCFVGEGLSTHTENKLCSCLHSDTDRWQVLQQDGSWL